jgi:cytochrome d ubiquinol oxidase subunit I
VGWIAAEVGRQPWIVHPPVEWDGAGDLVVNELGVYEYDEDLGLRTVNAGSPSVSGQQVLGSIIGFGLIYLSLLAAWLFVLDLKIRHGPEPAEPRPPPEERGVLDAAARRTAHAESMTGREGGP